MDFYARIADDLEAFRGKDSLRRLTDLKPDGLHCVYGGKRLLNLSGNDYLGLSSHKEPQEDFLRGLLEGGGSIPAMSSSSSRLLTGNHPEYGLLEGDLEALYGRPALLFNSGYHANVGMIPALAGAGDLILSDELNHASIIDGIRLSRAECRRYPHLDLARLEKLLEEAAGRYRNIFIVTESVYSMDGDVADLANLVSLKKHYGAVLYVDEAHAVGVFGPRGLGVSEEAGAAGDVDVIVGTFGKAYASTGAYGVTAPKVREYLVNTARTLLFSTALAPFIVAWTRRTLALATGMNDERRHLLALSERLRSALRAKGLNTRGRSQIVPLILGSNAAAVTAAEKLKGEGFLVFPIRPPTVPAGSARIRFSLNAGLTEGDVDRLAELL